MKHLLILAMLMVAGGCKIEERTYVTPAPEFKWRVCTTEYELGGIFTACSSPMSYGDALWWKEASGVHGVPKRIVKRDYE
jgi:hypothetical protein